jgi:hypothetical protein
MSDETTYVIRVPLREAQTPGRSSPSRGRPLPSSVPRAYTVRADTKIPGLIVKMIYRSVMDEPTIPLTYDKVTVEVGRYTGRVLGLQIRIDSLGRDNAEELARRAARELVPLLREVFADMRGGEKRAGPADNYCMTEAGLELGDECHGEPPPVSVPPWVVEGLRKLREEQASR